MVLLSAMVGLSEVLQTTPCSVGFEEPKTVILPLPVAVVVVMFVTAWVVTVGASSVVKVTILTIDCADCIGGIGPDVIERVGRQAGDVAGEGAGRADRTIRGFAVGRGRVRRSRPHNAVLGWIGDTQGSNVSVPHGCGGQDDCDRLGGDGWHDQGCEGHLLAIHGGGVIGGVGADMIERTGGQAGDGAGEGTDRADRAIRGLAIRGGGIGRRAPDHTVLGWIGNTQGSDVSVAGGCSGGDVR